MDSNLFMIVVNDELNKYLQEKYKDIPYDVTAMFNTLHEIRTDSFEIHGSITFAKKPES